MPVLTARRLQTGFTLIELLIVLVIVGVLAGIAYPSYSGYLKRSARADAKAELLRMQLAVEKQRLVRMGAAAALPATWTTSSGVAKNYQLSLQPQTAQNYTLIARALPGGGQLNDEQAGTSCSTLSLVVHGLEITYEPAVCWQQ
jgi:type IV pilus assembly protein PilE